MVLAVGPRSPKGPMAGTKLTKPLLEQTSPGVPGGPGQLGARTDVVQLILVINVRLLTFVGSNAF